MPLANDFQLNLFKKGVLHLFWKGCIIFFDYAC